MFTDTPGAKSTMLRYLEILAPRWSQTVNLDNWIDRIHAEWYPKTRSKRHSPHLEELHLDEEIVPLREAAVWPAWDIASVFMQGVRIDDPNEGCEKFTGAGLEREPDRMDQMRALLALHDKLESFARTPDAAVGAGTLRDLNSAMSSAKQYLRAIDEPLPYHPAMWVQDLTRERPPNIRKRHLHERENTAFIRILTDPERA
jgi:hypothetical protein